MSGLPELDPGPGGAPLGVDHRQGDRTGAGQDKLGLAVPRADQDRGSVGEPGKGRSTLGHLDHQGRAAGLDHRAVGREGQLRPVRGGGEHRVAGAEMAKRLRQGGMGQEQGCRRRRAVYCLW